MSTSRPDAARLLAIRGATTVPHDSAEEIAGATRELLEEIFRRNDLGPESVVSMIFTVTPDVTAEFPAAAVRAAGIADVPLLCAQEMAVPGAIERCIRVLMHLYTEVEASDLRHVYLREARQLRTDLPE